MEECYKLSQFFKNTLESKFIKYLLSYTPLPIFPTISSDDTIIEGCTYIYKDKILRCTKTGRFNGINANQFTDDHLYANEYVIATDEDYVLSHYNPSTRNYDIYIEDEGKEGGRYARYNSDTQTWEGADIPGIGGLTVTDDVVRYYYRPVGEYKILDDYSFGESVKNITQRFVSNVSYYDPQTHRFLGEYLRCVRDIYGVDLMPLYNCFDYDSTEYLYLDETKGAVEGTSPKYKVLLIPIKFNRTYTIAIDCEFPVLVKSVFCKDGILLKDEDDKSFTDLLHESTKRYNGIRFSNPVTYMISNDTSADLYMPDNDGSDFNIEDAEQAAFVKKREVDRTLQEHEKYLYMAIQIPKTNTSSVSVIEGDFSSVANRYVSSAEGINKLSDRQLSRTFLSKLSLLQSNSGKQVPYSDKLIAYLLQYTIDYRDEINENISGIETKINYRPALPDFVKGIWDVDLRYTLYSKYMNISGTDYIEKTDILGFVDRDIENAVNKGLIKHGV